MDKNEDCLQPSQSELIGWLHAVEQTTSRRFAGLITELYFSRYIRQSDRYSDVADGWAYIPDRSGSGRRFWFKIFLDHPEVSPVEQQFISCLALSGHRFFSLTADVTARGEKRLPEIKFQADELSVTDAGWGMAKTSGSRNAEAKINKLLTAYLVGTVHPKIAADIDKVLLFKRWVENCDVVELKILFLQRCFMNCRKPSPLDLDAVATTHDGRMAFIEFKRKYPTRGTSKFVGGPISPEQLASAASGIASDLRSANPRDMKNATRLFNAAAEKRGFKYVSARSFGLDMAHFETLKLCSDNGISYDYVVWNSEGEPYKGAFELSKIIADLENVLTDKMTEAREISWWMRSLKPTDACGLTFTWGDRSGSYDDRCRVQITFDAK